MNGRAVDAGDPRIGTVVADRYRLERFLGEGNLGPVYAATQLADGTGVAVKLLCDPGLHPADVAAKLRLDCDLLRRLAHPNLVEVIEVTNLPGGEPALVMEHLSGETLAGRLVRDGALPPAEGLRIAVRVASALSAAHRQGIVHSALRPEDVFLARSPGEPDVVKLLGFGLGRLGSDHSRVTVRSQRGTAGAYLAPEQLRPRARVDHRADQFALAAITYEMLTGACPFASENPAEVARKLLEHDPMPASRAAPDVPDVVDAILQRALRKDPMERYANMSQLGQALENAAAAASIQSRSRRQTPSSAPVAGSYRVVPDDVARATTDPVPSYLGELRRRDEARRSVPASPHPAFDPVERARQLAVTTRETMGSGALDEAVERAEAFFDHALANARDERVLEILRTHFSLLDRIFAERVGALDRCVRVIEPPAGTTWPELAPAALELIGMARARPTLREMLDRAHIPRRDAIRLLACLLRRNMLAVDG